jgi:hypothetical protein
MALTFAHNGLNQTPAIWQIAGVKLTRKSLAPDELEWEDAPRTLAAAPRWAAGDTVELFSAGTRVFVGTVLDPELTVQSGKRRWKFKAEGVWRRLERLVAQQAWTVLDHDTDTEISANKARIYFGARYLTTWVDGSFQRVKRSVRTGLMLWELMDWAAVTAEVPMAVGSIFGETDEDGIKDTGIYTPTWEESDITVAEAIRSILRWQPSAVAWIDYAPAIPELHIALEGTLYTQPVTTTDRNLLSVKCRSRTDLQVPGVHILFERTKEVDGEDYEYISRQTYPAAGDVTADGALVMSVDWKGETDSPPATLAEHIYGETSTLRHEGSVVFMSNPGTMDSRSWLGSRVTISEGQADWASMAAPSRASPTTSTPERRA